MARAGRERRLGIAVNLSNRQFLTGDIVRHRAGRARAYGLSADMLTLEVTESVLIDDTVGGVDALMPRAAQPRRQPLARRLRYRLLVAHAPATRSPSTSSRSTSRSSKAIGTEHEDTTIIAAVIAFANNLNLRVVAEGVETHAQLAKLMELGCPYMQGYLFSHPRPIDDVPGLIGSAPLAGRLRGDGGGARLARF